MRDEQQRPRSHEAPPEGFAQPSIRRSRFLFNNSFKTTGCRVFQHPARTELEGLEMLQFGFAEGHHCGNGRPGRSVSFWSCRIAVDRADRQV